jgi:hypothetical protein
VKQELLQHKNHHIKITKRAFLSNPPLFVAMAPQREKSRER